MPIRTHTDGVNRGRGRGRGRGAGRGDIPGPSAPGGGPNVTDSEEDPSMDSSTTPPSPHPQGEQAPLPDPALAAIHAVLVQLVQLQQANGQPAAHAPPPPAQPDYTKTVMLMKNLGTPSFGGCSNPIEADLWIESLDRNFAAIRCPPSYKKDIAVYYLERDAISWWQTVEGSYGQGVLDYHIFRREFERKYFPPEARDRLEIQYLDLTQGRATVREYEAEFTRLRRYAARAQQEDEDSVIRRFTRGLRPDIRTHLQVVRFYHLIDLVERAVNVEESLTAERAARAQMTSSRPPQSPSRQPPRGQGRDSSRPHSGRRCSRCNRRHTGRCREAPMTCHNCGNTGHFARNCPETSRKAPVVPAHIKCFTCGEPGHYATSCPQKHPGDPTFRQRAPALAGPSRLQLPPPPAKRPATAARVFAIDAPRPADRGKGPLTGE